SLALFKPFLGYRMRKCEVGATVITMEREGPESMPQVLNDPRQRRLGAVSRPLGPSRERLPEDRWFPLAVARTRITMRWAASLSVLGVGLAIWLERGASMGLAAFALLLGLIGLALHQSVARAGA
ncbi:MAG: hypothetical protein EBX71_05890, partial [Betaproteobacteria bacterium]|nr:hypothetical protein [Betaproteobacteria bacterium]